MVTQKAHEPAPQVENEPHRHAFVLVGDERLFGVHMTQYHCELHKYQIILHLHLPQAIYDELRKRRECCPEDTFVLCNAKFNDKPKANELREFCIPDLGSGRVTKFTANIFQGFRPISPELEAKDEHYFPWDEKYCKPALGEFTATVRRVVLFRPFDHLQILPPYARYFLFGHGRSGETHMTNLQTAQLITDEFTPPVFGPDYDHVMSLQQRPGWLQQDAMLEAGIVVTTPGVRLVDPDTGEPTIPPHHPFPEGDPIELMYRGIGPVRKAIAGPTFSYCTPVCNSPRFFVPRPEHASYLDSLPEVPAEFDFSTMPRRYWSFPDDD